MEARSDVAIRIVWQEAGTGYVLARRVCLETISSTEIIAYAGVPLLVGRLVQVDWDDPFETVARGRNEQKEGLEIRIVEQGRPRCGQLSGIIHVVEVEAEQTGVLLESIVLAISTKGAREKAVGEVVCLEALSLVIADDGTQGVGLTLGVLGVNDVTIDTIEVGFLDVVDAPHRGIVKGELTF